MELEILAVKAAVDYDLFVQNIQIEEALDRNELGKSPLAVESEGYEAIAQDRNNNSSEYKLKANIAKSKATDANERENLQNARRNNIIKYQDDYETRHTTPGNAHNYSERLSQVVDFLSEDLLELILKLRTFKQAIEKYYLVQLAALPEMEDPNLIHRLILTCKQYLSAWEVHSQNTSDSNWVISLTQQIGENYCVVDAEPFHSQIHNGKSRKFEFDPTKLFSRFKSARVIAIGASFSGKYDGALFRLTLFTPSQSFDNKNFVRPPVVLGAVGALGGVFPVAMETSSAASNIDPRGKWTAFLEPYAVAATDEKIFLEEPILAAWPMTDIKLHLRVSGILNDEIGGAFGG